MLNLEGVLSTDKLQHVSEYTELRIKNKDVLKTPEALTLYEQKYLPKADIKVLCERAYGISLGEPVASYVPQEVLNVFKGSGLVPVVNISMQNRVIAVYVPELEYNIPEIQGISVEAVATTIYYYLKAYQKAYGRHELLQDIPPKLLMDIIAVEGMEIGAADLTISTTGEMCAVYYNVKKKKVDSNRILTADCMEDIIKYLCRNAPYDFGSKKPKYVDTDLSSTCRGRIVINAKHKGYVITIRLLPKALFKEGINALGFTDKTKDWLSTNLLDGGSGLRLIVGETMSGKNTTVLAILRKAIARDNIKVVSVEMPVEMLVEGVEQIGVETEEEYNENVKSLIRANADIVYLTEINDVTGAATMQVLNIGSVVFSTVHANSVAATISRMMNVMKKSSDDIIEILHSIVFQELVRDEKEDRVYPKDRYVRFTEELKTRLYGKSLGEIITIITEQEDGDNWISTKCMEH